MTPLQELQYRAEEINVLSVNSQLTIKLVGGLGRAFNVLSGDSILYSGTFEESLAFLRGMLAGIII